MTLPHPIPERLARRPLDRHGRVLAWALGTIAGQQIQGVNQARLTLQAIHGRLCGACGQPLDYWIAFIGDENCVASRVFTEPPMHEECARYALAACPYLATPGYEAKHRHPDVQIVHDRARPDRMALYITRGYQFFPPPSPPPVPASKARAPHRIEWF